MAAAAPDVPVLDLDGTPPEQLVAALRKARWRCTRACVLLA
jgi:hypothetical protein